MWKVMAATTIADGMGLIRVISVALGDVMCGSNTPAWHYHLRVYEWISLDLNSVFEIYA